MKTFNVALLGCGRMGLEHARSLVGIPNAKVVAVADPMAQSRAAGQALTGAAQAFAEPEEAIGAPGVDAVLIVTPTATHAPLIELAARAGKAIFCEKPVALDMERTKAALAVVKEHGVPFQIGFNRRYDPPYIAAKAKLEAGALGELRQFRAVGRDPMPPSLDYLRGSGGQFIDQGVHDFDIARHLMGEVESVQAWGASHNPEIAALGDTDTTTTLLRFKSGALGVVENSRVCAYGYDIVTEVFGTGGKLVMDHTPKTPLRHYGGTGTGDGFVQNDHWHFFMDRFQSAYRLELEAFFRSLAEETPPTPGPDDALESLRLVTAAAISCREGRVVKLSEVE